MTATSSTVREYDVTARSTDVFGRVLCGVRDHHYIIDGPVQNGCPGQEVTPVEAFLSAVAAGGVELIQAIARDRQVSLRGPAVRIHGALDRSKQARADLTTLNSVALEFTLSGPSRLPKSSPKDWTTAQRRASQGRQCPSYPLCWARPRLCKVCRL